MSTRVRWMMAGWFCGMLAGAVSDGLREVGAPMYTRCGFTSCVLLALWFAADAADARGRAR